MHCGKKMLCLLNSSPHLSLTSWHNDWHAWRVEPSLVTHGAVSMKHANFFKLTEQLVLRTGTRLLSEAWSRALVVFPSPLKLSSRHAGWLAVSQFGNLVSAKQKDNYLDSFFSNSLSGVQCQALDYVGKSSWVSEELPIDIVQSGITLVIRSYDVSLSSSCYRYLAVSNSLEFNGMF